MDCDHTICELKEKIAVLEEKAKGAAMALVLADKLHAADRKATISLIISVGGAILMALFKRFT